LKLVAQIVGQVLAEQRAEKRARQLHHELAHSARAAALGELAAALAHELDQPLSAILTNAQSALRFLAQDNLDPEELRATLEDIVRDNRRASGLIHNLRAMLSRTPVAHEPCSLNDLIPEVVTFFHSQWIEPGIALHLDLAPDVPPVHVARVEVQQVLVNLLLNATQALEDAPEPHRRVLVATRREPGRIVVRVADEGPGIPETLLEQVFAPFYTTKSSGLGMGLAISRRLIEENGGTLAAHRNHPRGSVFEFRLPTAPAA
jgi:two-component system sensor kinase FixL